MKRLGLKSKFLLFMFSANLMASGLSVFRPEFLKAPPSSFDRFVQETTSSVFERTKEVRSILSGRLSALLEFFLGQGSTQETANSEANKIEAKIERGQWVSAKEVAKLELIRNEISSVSSEPGKTVTPKGWIVVLAPGQGLLLKLPVLIGNIAEKRACSPESIHEELAQIWNRTNYKNQTRVRELKNLVVDLMVGALEIKNPNIIYVLREDDLTPTNLVLSSVLFDAFLHGTSEVIQEQLPFFLSSLKVSCCLMGRDFSRIHLEKYYEELIKFLCHSGVLCDVASRVREIFEASVEGRELTVPTAFSKPEQTYRKSDAKVGQGVQGQVFLSVCGEYVFKTLQIQKDILGELLRPQSPYIQPILSVDTSSWLGPSLVSRYSQKSDLQRRIQDWGVLEPQQARIALWQILTALAALEKAGIIHGDLKSANILLQDDGSLVITDFGLACLNLPGIPDSTVFVTLGYRAPEVLLKIGPMTPAMDVFAAAVIFWEMLTGVPLLTKKSQDCSWEMNQMAVMQCMFCWPNPREWPQLYANPSTLEKFHACRSKMSAEELRKLQNKWGKFVKDVGADGHDLFNRLTQLNPEKRIKASEALRHPYFRGLTSPSSAPCASASAQADVSSLKPNDENPGQVH